MKGRSHRRTLPRRKNRSGLKEECGVFGILGVERAADLAYLGLYALQHRGQESSGIVAWDGPHVSWHKGMGLVVDVFAGNRLERLMGSSAIGHNRYSTTGSSRRENVQPLLVNFKGGQMAIAHNGNLVNAIELRKQREDAGSIFQTSTDSEVIVHLIAASRARTFEEMVLDALSKVRGAYALLLMVEGKLIGVRDPYGFRPLVLGKRGDGYILTSETCALDIVDAEFLREVEPGEMVIVDAEGVHSRRLAETVPHHAACVFELIYFARPDSVSGGMSVDAVRRRLGRRLAEEQPAKADIVIAVPDSSNSAALGFAEASGIPFELGLIRNHYIGRTFINPTQNGRDHNVRVKFNPVREVLSGRRVVVVDDSIVRGTTSKKLVKMLRKAGAKEIHLRVSSPPITSPCYYWIDTPRRSELIASTHSVEEIRDFLGVDSIGYLSEQGLRDCVSLPDEHCYACFNGQYPVAVSGEAQLGTGEKDFLAKR